MSLNAVSSWDIMDSPSFCLSGIAPLQLPKEITDFNPINFLDLLGFFYIYCQPLFDFNKDLLTKYNKFHAHISGDAVIKKYELLHLFLGYKRENVYIFNFFPPPHFQTK